MTSARYLLAIDGGQTATKALLARVDGVVVASGRGGPSDHFHIEGGVEKNRIAIHGAISSALAGGQIDGEIAAIGLGLTGAPAIGEQNPTIEAIVREVISPARIVVSPDYVTNLAGASGGEPGVVLIAGGGAIGYGLTEDGRSALAGGYGFLLGDEGSAFKIGLHAIAAATRASDLRAEPTALQTIVEHHFEIASIRQVPRVVYKSGFQRERISLLAPAVVEAAERGDKPAKRILSDAGHELALTALGVIRQLYDSGAVVDVYLTGGVFSAGPLVQDALRKTLADGWSTARPREPRFPPAAGALILAARAAGIRVDDVWLSNVERSIAGMSL